MIVELDINPLSVKKVHGIPCQEEYFKKQLCIRTKYPGKLTKPNYLVFVRICVKNHNKNDLNIQILKEI